MSVQHRLPAFDAPLRTAFDTRLHNSGWARPSEQYVTPAIGTGIILDIHAMLLSWCSAPSDIIATLPSIALTSRRYPPSFISRCAHALLADVGGSSTAAVPPTAQALTALSRLTVDRGLTDGVVLTCALIDRKPNTPLNLREVSAEEIALALVTLSSARPPMVLWRIEPIQAAMSPATMLRVRWLRRNVAGQSATAIWNRLSTVTPRGGTDASR